MLQPLDLFVPVERREAAVVRPGGGDLAMDTNDVSRLVVVQLGGFRQENAASILIRVAVNRDALVVK